MRMLNRFTRICLVLIVALLVAILVRPLLVPQPARAASPYTYTTVRVYCNNGGNPTACADMQVVLNKYSSDGWEMVAPVQSDMAGIGLTLIFKR